jgi:5-methylcytosine-specific restriction endonuclease McrA
MPAKGKAWELLLASFKAECKGRGDNCWICREEIDYELRGRQTRAFSADHIVPTSLPGGQRQVLRRANLRPSHYGCNSRRGNTTRGEYPTSRQW